MTQQTIRPAPGPVTWAHCPGCGSAVYRKRLDRNFKVCPECRHHFRLSATERLDLLVDDGSLVTFGGELLANDPLGFTDTQPYPKRLAAARAKTGRNDAAVAAKAAIDGIQLVVVALDFSFMGGSVGGVVGELVARACERALAGRLPLLIVSASGGARMQEGALSLMQLAKTAQAIADLHEAGLVVINLNTDPTFGGATASFSMLGDIIIAEPGALIGFAGPQVIKQTIRQDLPAGFQSAEFLFQHGFLDLVVEREHLPSVLARLLRLHTDPAPDPTASAPAPTVTAPEPLTRRPAREAAGLARNTSRPTTLDYLTHTFDEFTELHGDRVTADDPAVIGGIGKVSGRTVVFIGHQKGHDTAELIRRNFGMPNPEGYRKALRLMRHAARFHLPLVTFVDTPGAFPGVEAEERGQGPAIAECIMTMSRLPVPTVALVTGEGGSGGALALGVGNTVLMLENAYYSVISPEGCSTILFGSAAEAPRAAEALKLTAPDLLDMGIVDGVVPEPEGGAHTDPLRVMDDVRDALTAALDSLTGLTPGELLERRHARFRRFGTPSTQVGESL